MAMMSVGIPWNAVKGCERLGRRLDLEVWVVSGDQQNPRVLGQYHWGLIYSPHLSFYSGMSLPIPPEDRKVCSQKDVIYLCPDLNSNKESSGTHHALCVSSV